MIQDLVQEIENLARDVMSEIHTSIPGEIISFDSEKCVATVKPLGKYAYGDTTLPYPIVSDVPVVFPMAKDIGVAFPVKKGDTCLLIVSEVDLDLWRNGSDTITPMDFDLTNAIAITGLLKSGNGLIKKSCDENAVIIANGSTQIAVKGDTVAIKGNLSVDGNITCTGDFPKE